MKSLLISSIVLATGLSTLACNKQKEPDTADDMEDAADDVEDAADEMADDTEDAFDDAAEETEDELDGDPTTD